MRIPLLNWERRPPILRARSTSLVLKNRSVTSAAVAQVLPGDRREPERGQEVPDTGKSAPPRGRGARADTKGKAAPAPRDRRARRTSELTKLARRRAGLSLPGVARAWGEHTAQLNALCQEGWNTQSRLHPYSAGRVREKEEEVSTAGPLTA